MTAAAVRAVFRHKAVRWGLVLIGLPIVAFVALWMTQSTSLESRLEALRLQGHPTSLSELEATYSVPDGVPNTTEAWMTALAAVERLENADDESGVSAPPESAPGTSLSEEQQQQLARIRQRLERARDALPLIHAACEPGGCARFPVNFAAGVTAQLTHVQRIRSAARLLDLDAWVAVHDGDHDRALRDVRAIVQTSQALRQEPTILGQLIRIAVFRTACDRICRLLPHADWSDAELAALQQLLREPDLEEATRTALIGERAVVLFQTRAIAHPLVYYPNADWILTIFDRTLNSLSDGWTAAIAEQAALTTEIRATYSGVVSRLVYLPLLQILPALESSITAGARSAAVQRATIAVIAAERYRRQHAAVPESLSDIPDEFFAPRIEGRNDSEDPFTREPLLYRVTPESLTVYSVGDNGVDDGGMIDAADASGRSTQDVGVRLEFPTAE